MQLHLYNAVNMYAFFNGTFRYDFGNLRKPVLSIEWLSLIERSEEEVRQCFCYYDTRHIDISSNHVQTTFFGGKYDSAESILGLFTIVEHSALFFFTPWHYYIPEKCFFLCCLTRKTFQSIKQ